MSDWFLLVGVGFIIAIAVRYTKLGKYIAQATPTSAWILFGGTMEIIFGLSVLLFFIEGNNQKIPQEIRSNPILFFTWCFFYNASSETLSGLSLGVDFGYLSQFGRYTVWLACLGGMLITAILVLSKRKAREHEDLALTKSEIIFTIVHVFVGILVISAFPLKLFGLSWESALITGGFGFANAGFANDPGNATISQRNLPLIFFWAGTFVWGGLGFPLAATYYYRILDFLISVSKKFKLIKIKYFCEEIEKRYPKSLMASDHAITIILSCTLFVNCFGLSVLLHDVNWNNIHNLSQAIEVSLSKLFDVTSAHTAGFNIASDIFANNGEIYGGWSIKSQIAIYIVMLSGTAVGGTGGGIAKYVALSYPVYFFGEKLGFWNVHPNYSGLWREVLTQVGFGLLLVGLGSILIHITIPEINFWWETFYLVSAICNVGYDPGVSQSVVDLFIKGRITDLQFFIFAWISILWMLFGKLSIMITLFLTTSWIFPGIKERLPGWSKVS